MVKSIHGRDISIPGLGVSRLGEMRVLTYEPKQLNGSSSYLTRASIQAMVSDRVMYSVLGTQKARMRLRMSCMSPMDVCSSVI